MALRLPNITDQSNTAILKKWTQSIEDRLNWLEKNGTFGDSGNFILQRAVGGPGNGEWWLTPTHMSYRPLSNPLHGTNISGQAAIVIDAFTMRVGHMDISNGGGQIATGLSWDTLYFVYYDDVDLSGGAQVYFCDRFKEVALSGDGRLFVGSVRTPLSASSVDTVGNNDGGVGAQMGGHIARYPTTRTVSATSSTNDYGTGVDNPDACIDKNWNTYTSAHATTTDQGGQYEERDAYAEVSVAGLGSNFADSDRWYTHLRVRVKVGGSAKAGAGTSSGCSVEVYVNGQLVSSTTGSNGQQITLPVTTFNVSLPDGTNPTNVNVQLIGRGYNSPLTRYGSNTSASVQLYEAIIEGDY